MEESIPILKPTITPPDEQIMQQVRNGDARKLGLLFERYQTPLYNFYLRMTGDRASSEDLVQDVFLRILRYRHTYQDGTAFSTWMYQIARNARFDHFRKRRGEVALDGAGDVGSPAPSAVDNLESKQETALIRRALARLPHQKREVLVLSRFQNMKYEEIGRILDCEAGAVKERVYRALRDHRQIYSELTKEKAS